jgi:hypothetical protein
VQAAIEGVTSFLGSGELSCRAPALSSCSRLPLGAAHIHVDGRPRWGCLREIAAQAKQDLRDLLAARKEGHLDRALAELRSCCQSGSSDACSTGVKDTQQPDLDTWGAVGD